MQISEFEKKTERFSKMILVAPICIIAAIILFQWTATNFANYIPGSFRNSYGFEAPEGRVFVRENLMAVCAFNPFYPCNIKYRFADVGLEEFEEIKVRSQAAGFSDWGLGDSCEGGMGHYGCGRNGADSPREQRYMTSRDPTNTSWHGLYYYPSNQTLDAVWFGH